MRTKPLRVAVEARLSAREEEIIEAIAARAMEPVPLDELAAAVGIPETWATVSISRARSKLQRIGLHRPIVWLHGRGYLLSDTLAERLHAEAKYLEGKR